MDKVLKSNTSKQNRFFVEEKTADKYPQSIFINFIKEILVLGITGFSTFFTIILSMKIIRYLFSLDSQLVFDIKDIEYSLIGFFLLSLYKIIERSTHT